MSNTTLSNVYAAGLSDERLVKDFLRAKGMLVVEPSRDQDMFDDVDAFVNGVAVSIKAQHTGLAYGNICFELAQQLTSHQDCPETKKIITDKNLSPETLDKLVALGSWETSWYQNGKAALYYIYQGTRLHVYTKASIQSYVAAHGWLRLRPLSRSRSAYLGGAYRYCNSVCGFLDTQSIPHLSYQLLKTRTPAPNKKEVC